MFMNFHRFMVFQLDLLLLCYIHLKFIKDVNFQGQGLGNFQYKVNKPKLLADIHGTGQDNLYR